MQYAWKLSLACAYLFSAVLYACPLACIGTPCPSHTGVRAHKSTLRCKYIKFVRVCINVCCNNDDIPSLVTHDTTSASLLYISAAHHDDCCTCLISQRSVDFAAVVDILQRSSVSKRRKKDVRKTVIEASVFDNVICPSVVLSACTQTYHDAITARIAIDVCCKDSTPNKLHDG
jgi:hypothetical protein